MEDIRKAKEYAKIKNWLISANIGITTLSLIIILLSLSE